MSERGVFAVDRGIWDHPVFADEPLTEREAWQWLISEAAFRSRKKRVGNTIFDLERGQLVASIRFMAEAWQWHRNKVCRFLAKLKTETMIEQQPGHDATKITICNYTKYQRVSLPDGTPSGTRNGTATGHERDKLEDIKNIEIDDDDGKRARPPEKLISDEAHQTADALAAACGFPDPVNCPIGWYGVAAWVQKCFNEGWPADLMVEATKIVAQRKRDGPIEHFKYLEKPLAKAIAEHLRPLPKIEMYQAETVRIPHGKAKSGRGGSLIEAIDRQLAAIELSENPAAEMPTGAVLCLPSRSIR